MDLERQFKVIFYAFSYGILFISTYRFLRLIIFKKLFFKYLTEFFFCITHLIVFYFFLYKINNGIINMYVPLFLILGGIFCKVFYFSDKNR